MSTEEREESQPRPRKVIPSIRRENTDQEVKEDLTIKVTTDLRETTMNGDHMTVRAGMTAAVIILTGITALLTEIVRAVLVRMTTAKVVVITADHLITTVAVMEIIARVVTVTIVKVVTTQIAKVATTAVLLMATIAPLTATMTVRMVVAVLTTVLLVLTMTKDQADLILLRRKVLLLVTA